MLLLQPPQPASLLWPAQRRVALFRLSQVESRMAAAHRSGTENHAQRLWSLINLELWHRVFVDGEEPQRVELPAVSAASMVAA